MMYLKGSKLQMKRRRRMRRTNPALVILLLGAIGLVIYFDNVVVDSFPEFQTATPEPTRDPEAILQEAIAYFNEGNLNPAIDAYKQAVLADPTNSNIHVELARVQILAGQYEAAQTSAENALLLNRENPKALAIYGWALTFLGYSIEARQAFDDALELNPNDAATFAYYAELMADEGDFALAGEYSRRATELDPNLLEVRRARGYVLELTANYDQALIEYQEAIALNNKIADLHLSVGRVNWALGFIPEAIEAFSTADSLDPANPLPEAYISLIYLGQGEYAKAIQFAKGAVENDPSNPTRYGRLGIALYRNFEYQEAIEAFGYAVHGGTTENDVVVIGINLSPQDADFFYFYGLALARTGRCSDALPVFQAILAGVPGNEIAIFNSQEGIRICEELISNPPTATPFTDDQGDEG